MILVYHPASYINSAVSSASIYALHAQNPLNFKSDVSQAVKLVDSYKALVRRNVDLEIQMAKATGDTAQLHRQLAEARRDLENHELHNVMKHGISATIRSDAYKTGTMGENEAIRYSQKVFGDKQIGERLKTFIADPGTSWGKTVGKIYDATELYPKIALYLSKLRELNDADQAIQSVLMAFPTYNNLHPMLNAIDQISPYTKYMANFPKMLGYSVIAHPYKFAAMRLTYSLSTRALVDGDSEQEWERYEKGFVKVPGTDSYYWYFESAFPYNFPSKTFDDSDNMFMHLINFNFLGSAVDNIFDPNPLVKLD
jgi:hypothetical protein